MAESVVLWPSYGCICRGARTLSSRYRGAHAGAGVPCIRCAWTRGSLVCHPECFTVSIVARGCAQDESELACRWKWYAWHQMEKCGGATGEAVEAVASGPRPRRWVASTPCRWQSRRVFQAGRRCRARAAPTALRNHRSVMQGVPLPTRGCSRTPRRKEKWNATQWCGRARRLYTPRGLQWSASVVTVSLLERYLSCCASPTPTAGLF